MKKLGLVGVWFLFQVIWPVAQAQTECPGGTPVLVMTPNGSTLSVLFSDFVVEAGGAATATGAQKSCSLRIPLVVPPGFSVGVYKVDYRGFAHLSQHQVAELSVDYALGPHHNGRRFRRAIKGDFEGDFLFKETLGAGVLKRVGCGEGVELWMLALLSVKSESSPERASVTLDSADGAPKRGLIYHFDFKKCH